MKVTPPHTRLAPWRRIAGITNPDTTLPPGVDPPPTDPDDDPVDRGSSEQGANAVALNDGGTPAVVSGQIATDDEAAASFIVLTLPNPPTAGNTLVVWHIVRGGATLPITPTSPASGWTQHPSGTVGYSGGNASMFYRTVQSGDSASVTVSANAGTNQWAAVVEIENFSVTDTDENTGSGTSVTSAAVTPTAGIPAMILAGFVHADPFGGSATPNGAAVEIADGKVVGLFDPTGWLGYLDVANPSGSSTVGATFTQSGDWGSQVIAITGTDAEWNIPAPRVNDGDDATYDTVTGTELIRIDLGAAFDITRTRIRVAATTSGARTFTIKGANSPDFSDEVTLTTIDFTATGSLTAQDVTGEWDPPEDYRFFQLDIDDSDTYRIHTWELFEDPPPETDDHGGLTGLGDDDHPQYLRVRDGGGDQVSTIGAAGATETIDLANGNVHNVTLDDDCTFTFTGAVAGRARSFRLYLWQDGTGGHVVTWPGSVEWAGGAPTISTTADTLSVFMFETLDGGTVWHGYPVGGGSGSSGPDVELVENAATGATETVDVSVARTYDLTLTDDLTLTLSGAVNNEAHFVTIAFRQDGTGGWTVTHPGSVVWADGAPTIDPDPAAVTWVTYASLDGGTVWYGFPIGGTGGGGATELDDLTDVVITAPAEGHEIRYRSGFWVNEVPASPRWELVVTGTAPPVPMTNDAEDDFLYAPV